MEFIDRTGHIFSLNDYTSYPTGYEYNEQPYVFWLSDDYASQLSIDCIYIKPIRFITSKKIEEIEITLKDTSVFRLLSSKELHERLDKSNDLFNELEINFYTENAEKYINNTELSSSIKDSLPKNDLKMLLSTDDLDIIPNVYANNYFYVENNKETLILDESMIYHNIDKDLDYFTKLKVDAKRLFLQNITNESKDIFGHMSDSELIEYYKGQEFYNPKSFIYIDKSTGNYLTKDKFDENNINHKQFTVGTRSEKYSIIPFYVIGCTSEAASWITNILIKLTANDEVSYCPISVGGTFVDETEELTINANNMGIKLPKEICRALYNMSFWNETPDMSLWNQKVKEYLLNYMKLFGERGNFQSAINALKWFGYNDRIQLSSLIQTDNQFIDQYIINNFDIQYDVIDEFRYFRNSTLISLSIPGIVNTNEDKTLDFTQEFWGEGKPITENLFEKTVTVKHDNIEFIKPFYDWTFTELGIKLSALKYYYQKYFLPIHLSIHRSSITNQYYAPTMKLLNSARTLITEYSLFTGFNYTTVEFENSKFIWLSEQCRTVDENWIEDPTYQTQLNNLGILDNVEQVFFDIIDNCFAVKFWLVNKKWSIDNPEQVFNCKLLAYQGNKLMKECSFSICSKEQKYVMNFIIYPKVLNPNFDINFWLDQDYKIELFCNGSWFTHNFNIKVPELDIEVGKLKYVYDGNMFKQFSKFDGNKPIFNIEMWQPDLVTINNVNFINDLCEYFVNEKRYHITGGLAKFVDEYLDSNSIYYYYFDENGHKTYLSSSNYVLVKEYGDYVIKTNKYVKKDKDGNYNDNEATIINCAKDNRIFVSVYKNIYSFIDLYSVEQSIPRNDKFLNKMYIFDLYERDEYGNNIKLKFDNKTQGKNIYADEEHYESLNEKTLFGKSTISYIVDNPNDINDESLKIEYGQLKFSDNDSEFVKHLYKSFFNTNNGNWDKELQYWEDNQWKTTYIEQSLFDLYIMHDMEYWYAVIISKNTIGNSLYNFDDIIKKYYKSYDTEQNKIYTLELQRSEDKFLINRMEFLSMDGIYHFNPSDMIVARLNNFNTLGYKLKIGSRWSFYPLAVGSQSIESFVSDTNIGMLSIKQDDQKHSNGYYSIQVNYSIDNFVNDVQTRKTRILITDKIPSPEGRIINTPTIKIKPKITINLVNDVGDTEENITSKFEYIVKNNSSVFNNLFDMYHHTINVRIKNSNEFKLEYKYNDNEWKTTNCNENGYSFILNTNGWDYEFETLYNKTEPEYENECYGHNEIYKLDFHTLENNQHYASDEYSLTFIQQTIYDIYDYKFIDYDNNININQIHNYNDIKLNSSDIIGFYNTQINNHYKNVDILYSRDTTNWFKLNKCLLFYFTDEMKLDENGNLTDIIYYKNDGDENYYTSTLTLENHSLSQRPTTTICTYPVSLSYKVVASTTSNYWSFLHTRMSNEDGIIEYNNPLNNKSSIISLNITNYGFDGSKSTTKSIILKTDNIKVKNKNGDLVPLFLLENKEYSNSASLNITIPFLVDNKEDRQIFGNNIYSTFNDWENISDDENVIEKHLVIDIIQRQNSTKAEELKTYTIIIKQDKRII